MLVIRQDQLSALGNSVRRSFESSALAHVSDVFAAAVQALGVEAAQARIRAAIDRAAGYGITAREDVLLFLDLDFELGAPFEEQLGFYWAATILAARTVSPRARMLRIYDRLLAEGGSAG